MYDNPLPIFSSFGHKAQNTAMLACEKLLMSPYTYMSQAARIKERNFEIDLDAEQFTAVDDLYVVG